MSWGVLSKKIPVLLGLKNQFYLLMWSFTKQWCPSLGKCWWKNVVVHLLVLPPFDIFIIIPSKVESLNSWTYILYSTCFTREQVDNTFTVTIKFMIYFLTPMWNKTMKNACIVNIKTSLACTFFTTRWSTFT